MEERVRSDAMHTARLAPNAADLTPAQLASLRSVDNVAALDTRTLARTEIRIEGRTEGVILVGVADFDNQTVNIVSRTSGTLPDGPNQLVTDSENARTGRFGGSAGDAVEVRTHTGGWRRFTISGSGGTVRYSSEVAQDAPVLYMANTDVQSVMNYPAPNSIDVVAANSSPEAVREMVTQLRSILAAELPNLAYWDVLEVWRAGTWPGSEDFGNFIVVFYVIAGIGLVSALILIFTTMNTMVREQIREIGMMKAIGGAPRSVAVGFLRTALLLGGIGTVAGIAIGIPLSNWLMAFMSDEFGGTHVGSRLSVLALALSIVVGLGGTAAASWPALRRAARITVREAIDDHGVVGTYGLRPLDRVVARIPVAARRSQLGVRNATRRTGRTIATALPIGLAVATMLAFGSVLITAVNEDLNTFDLEGGDIILWNRNPGLDAQAGALIESVPEVAFAHPMVYSSVELDGERYVWGLTATSTYDHDVIAGRWFTQEEADDADRVVVVGEALASKLSLEVGDTVSVETRRGPIDLDIVGIDGQLVNNAQGMFVPFETVLDYEGWTTGHYWVRTADPEPATVTTAAAGIQGVLENNGYEVASSLRYIDRDQNMAENRLIVTVVMAMGLPVVAIGMIGLVSAMTSNVLDRTREIGILRSIGARRRDLRAMFRAEGLAIAILGWLIGIPVGYGLARFILWVFERRFDAAFTFRFPLWTIAISLIITLTATLIVIRLPLRRVVRMSPGLALRYE
ncbi:MAG: FtsX-like permease family protein [Acidimicrobiales bacterium]|nr:FtsX-like permease family protein [Acidimicrobiales bacterium]